jgi:hypothetical protein
MNCANWVWLKMDSLDGVGVGLVVGSVGLVVGVGAVALVVGAVALVVGAVAPVVGAVAPVVGAVPFCWAHSLKTGSAWIVLDWIGLCWMA